VVDQLKALVVYESMFGNTEQIAWAISEGLGQTMEVTVRAVGDASADLASHVDLLVVGGPTHAFGMSRPATRVDASSQGQVVMGPDTGIREWLHGLTDRPGAAVAASFDTRVAKVSWMPGSAARGAAKLLRGRGYPLLAKPESFFVVDSLGPLTDDELARARRWGSDLARQLTSGAHRTRTSG